MELVTDRMICERMVRQRTPLRLCKRCDIPSPSRAAADQLLLPNLTKSGQFAFSSSEALSHIFKIKAEAINTNPYSLDNLKAPLTKSPKPKQNRSQRILTAEEIRKSNHERSKLAVKKHHNTSINRLKLRSELHPFNYLLDF